jgi:biopolymer transport protein ExbD
MKLQNRAREELEISLTSLIDVVLVLLVFFMISTSFVSETEIHLRLPEAKADAATSAPDSLEIMVTEKGAYFVNGHPLVNNEARTLRTAVQKLIGDRRDMPVLIKADALATHQSVVTAMDVAGQLGFVNISIATVTSPE